MTDTGARHDVAPDLDQAELLPHVDPPPDDWHHLAGYVHVLDVPHESATGAQDDGDLDGDGTVAGVVPAVQTPTATGHRPVA